mmetsp:Transcript_165011/g.292125  ORF Transcript_165011/g.292125 Transcript_165011/m.292125 type:complete len:817 (+) Transcript_165011:65-2515(+)
MSLPLVRPLAARPRSQSPSGWDQALDLIDSALASSYAEEHGLPKAQQPDELAMRPQLSLNSSARVKMGATAKRILEVTFNSWATLCREEKKKKELFAVRVKSSSAESAIAKLKEELTAGQASSPSRAPASPSSAPARTRPADDSGAQHDTSERLSLHRLRKAEAEEKVQRLEELARNNEEEMRRLRSAINKAAAEKALAHQEQQHHYPPSLPSTPSSSSFCPWSGRVLSSMSRSSTPEGRPGGSGRFSVGTAGRHTREKSPVATLAQKQQQQQPLSRVAAARIATARSGESQADRETSVRAFWDRHPEAVAMLDGAIEKWVGISGARGAEVAAERAAECASAFSMACVGRETALASPAASTFSAASPGCSVNTAALSAVEVIPGGPTDENDTLWARVLLGQEAQIAWFAADNAVRRTRLGLQERLPDITACPAAQRELRVLHNEATAHQELIEELLTSRESALLPAFSSAPSTSPGLKSPRSPRSPRLSPRGSPLMSSRSRVSTWSSSREFSQEQGEDFPPREDSEESSVPLAGLRRAFVRSGLTVRTPEALAELMRHDVAEVVGALLEDAWRLRRHCRARHTAALEATQQARLAAEGARCERLMRENARLLGELAESDERRQALNSDRNRYAASVALRLRADPSLAARQEGTSKLSLEWVDEQAEAAAGSRELAAASPEKSSSSVAAMPASLKHGAGPAPGVTWSPPGAAAPSHHKAHTSNEGESGAFTTAARTAAFTTSTRTNPTLTPWWKNRSATRQTTSAKEDERFDSYSIYHPGQGGAPMANRCRASPGLAAIAYTPWRSAAALSGSSNRR